MTLPKRLTKQQRAKLITAEERERVLGLSEEHLLALHDLTHEVMDIKFGTTSRPEAGLVMLARRTL